MNNLNRGIFFNKCPEWHKFVKYREFRNNYGQRDFKCIVCRNILSDFEVGCPHQNYSIKKLKRFYKQILRGYNGIFQEK